MIKVVLTLPEERIKRYGIKPPEEFELIYLKQPYTDEELIEVCKDATFIFVSLSPVSKDVINKLDSVKLIQSEGAGYDGIDLEAAYNKGIYVCNAKGVNKEAVAEHTIGLILASLRRTVESDKQIKSGNFTSNYLDYERKGIRELKSCHVGIIGLGEIGKEVVMRLKPFKCRVSYYSTHRKSKSVEDELGIDYMSFEQICKNCDIISIHSPLTPDTKYLINKDTINFMKRHAIIINTARGDIINQHDLADALIQERIEGAAIDTISPQPPTHNHPLLNLPDYAANKVTLTAHIAGITSEAFARMQVIAWNNMLNVLRGEKPEFIVNNL